MAQDAFQAPTITASGTTWAQLKAGGLKAVIDNLMTANAAKANPSTQATVAITAATGGLAAGTYFCSYTFVDAFGETLAGGESASFTVTGTAQLATVTLPAKPTGVQAMNLYVTAVGGAAGSEKLFATGITGTSFALTDTIPADVSGAGVPTSNTTGAAAHIQRIYSILPGSGNENEVHRITQFVDNNLNGAPISRQDMVRQHVMYAGITKLWSTALAEIGTLRQANMPTAMTNTVNGIGNPQPRWTLP